MSDPGARADLSGRTSISDRLDSWKEIATYLRRDIRTVQRWEQHEGLPVHRHHHGRLGSTYAYRAEIDEWWKNRHNPVERREQHEETSDSQARASMPLRSTRLSLFAALAVALFLVGITAFMARRIERRSSVAPRRIEGLAVLPFQNLSGDQRQEYLGDDITEGLITELGRINRLRVISRTSIMSYKDTRKPLREVARELHVDAIVEGTVARSGNRVRVTVQLIDAGNDRHLWAQSYEGDLRDVLSFQDEIARTIASEVQAKLTPEAQTAQSSPRSTNIGAYDAYLKGRYFANKRTEDGLKKSLGYFQKVTESDPAFAPAHAGMAASYALLTGYGDAPAREFYPKARAAVMKALARDDALAEAHAVLGLVNLYYDWDWAGAEREFRRSIELQPAYATAHHWLAYCLLFEQRPKEALGEIERAQQLDPLSLIISTDVAGVLYFERRYNDAIQQIQKTLELDTNFAPAHATLGMAHVQTSDYREGLKHLEQAATLSGGGVDILAQLGYAYAVAGRKGEARKILNQLRRLSKQKHVRSDRFALVYAGLGETEEAIRWLEKAYAENERPALIYLKVAPEFDSLRSNLRFQDFLRRAGLGS